jgi:choline dehydrogenase-like flavoprotein
VKLSARNLATFTAIVDTVLPSIDGDGPAWTTRGADLGFAERLPDVFDHLPHDQDRKDLLQLLRLLNSRAGGMLLFGSPAKFRSLSPTRRADAYRSMTSHRMSLVRNGAKALKALCAFLWVSTSDANNPPASWGPMGYPGPDGPPPLKRKTIEPEEIDRDTTMTADVVVVGSGAGGGTAAGVLAAAGLDVIVLESGGYRNEADFSHLEFDTYRSMYLHGALGSTADGGVQILAGATLGGGTVINYTTSFATPPERRAEWDSVAGFDGVFQSDAYQASLDAVMQRLNVNQDNGTPSVRDQLLEKGLRGKGWHVGEMPRNVDGCTEDECGYCTMGCRIGAKQSMLKTYLQDAAANSARVVTNADVRHVETVDGRASGVVAQVGSHTVRIDAKAVVLAAGALNTPAILLRSGLGGPAAGRYLRLHPVTAVWGRFEQAIEPWRGVMQARYTDEFDDLDGKGHGFKFETAPVHPLLPAGFLGWEDGASFKRDVLGLSNLNVTGILLRERDHGRVTIRKDGSPVWNYVVSKYDRKHVRIGVQRAAELMAEAGAHEILSSSVRPARWRPGAGAIEGFMADVDAVGYGPNRTSYFTFHQMGSARMGSDPKTSVADALNETHDTKGLYVLDGSCFPTASGVNPMISIAAIAHRGATLLADRIA